MNVELRPMREEEYADWVPRMRDDYARSMSEEGGIPAERAKEQAASQVEQLFPGGRSSPEQLVFVVESDGDPVGQLWLADRDDVLQRCLFVYQLYIDEAYRGCGYGKAAMLLAEEEARRRGIARLALNVFGRNTVARRLYQSLGYEENAVAMSKALGSG
jgi:GNAT superfamily N-acetyltransferase